MANFFKKKSIVLTFCLVLVFVVTASFIIIRNKINLSASDMISNVKKQNITGSTLDNKFINGTADFSVNLLKNSVSKEKNTMISPMSAYIALGMTANGADGNTRSQFEKVLCKDTDIENLNKYYYTFWRKGSDRDVNTACSLWYNKNYAGSIKKEFLQKNVDYYNAGTYSMDFSKEKAAKDINKWVSSSTNGKIKEMVKETDDSDVMMIINTLYFNKKWQNPYEKGNVTSGRFANNDGTTAKADFMHSIENEYVHDDLCEGFIKNYEGNKMSFVAMLPKKEMSMDDFLSSLTGERFLKYMNSREKIDVTSSIPQGKYDYSVMLNEPLRKMGLTDAFDSGKADFGRMSDKSLYISKVLQKTHIDIGLSGTEAAAATEVEMKETCVAMQNPKTITLDRPFVFAIVNNETGLPYFMGTVIHM